MSIKALIGLTARIGHDTARLNEPRAIIEPDLDGDTVNLESNFRFGLRSRCTREICEF